MEAKVESTEDKIIYATIKLLDKNGLTGTTTNKIASESGFSEVTIYRKFKNKENLFEIAKKTYYDTFFKKLDEILDYNPDADIREYLSYIWKEIIILSDNETNMIKIAIDEFRDSTSKNRGLPKFANIVIDKLSKFFQHQIDNGKIRKINPRLAAYNIFCLIFESIAFWKLYDSNHSNIDVDSYLNDFLDMFMNGISINS
jgi:AcrR family transcriptional regulator